MTMRSTGRAFAFVASLVLLVAFSPAPAAATTVLPASAIIPGAVDQTSMNLRATYASTVRLSFATRAFKVHVAATITNISGGPIDRVELNTAVARLGRMRLTSTLVDDQAVAAGPEIPGPAARA